MRTTPIRALSILSIAASFCSPVAALAASSSPAGYWKTIDDETNRQRSVVRIWIDDGKAFGEIVQLYRKPSEKDDLDPLCKKCEGEMKKQKVNGLVILKNLVKDGDEWGDGEILDPANGKYYSSYIEVLDNGMKLKVRGYLGISLLGRTQYWYRVPKPDLTIRSFMLGDDGSIEPVAWAEGHGPVKAAPALAPTESGGEPVKAGGEPVKAGSEPVKTGSEPVKAGSEPAKTENEPAGAGGAPAKAVPESK